MEQRKRRWTLRRAMLLAIKYIGIAALFFSLGTAFGMYSLLKNSPNLWLRTQVLAMFEQRQQDPGGQNAALRYWYAWQWAGTDDVIEADLVQADVQHGGAGLTPAQRRTLEDETVQTYIAEILRATRHHECDFGVDYQDGAGAALAHLGKLRGSARTLACDAYLKAIDGDPAAAVERIGAILAIARHASSDRQILSSLVAGAVCEFAIGWADRLLDEGLVTRTEMAGLVPELNRLATWDLGMREALEMQRSQAAITIASVPFLVQSQASDGMPDLRAELGLHLTDTLVEQTESIQALYDEVLGVWDQSDSVANLQLIELETASGVYGEIARPLAPIFVSAYRVVSRTRDRATVLSERLADGD